MAAAIYTSDALDALTSIKVGERFPQGSAASILQTVANRGPDAIPVLEVLRLRAYAVLNERIGTTVHYRGLLEFSNECACNCIYCGIRALNTTVRRFSLTLEEIVQTARWCATNGYGSITLQSGEQSDPAFTHFVEEAVCAIKLETATPQQPEGLGITLCCGEQSLDTFLRWKKAGALRYLLRFETSNPELYRQLHPDAPEGLSGRLEALARLHTAGYRVGTGTMIGIPGQTVADMADDLETLASCGAHMVGMGPYLPHAQTPLGKSLNPLLLPDRTRFQLGLAMVGLCRLRLPGINIASTTALQALHPFGRERGLDFGANILMPLVTPERVRADYLLYDGKPCIDDAKDSCRDCLATRVASVNRPVGWYEYGDQPIIQPGYNQNKAFAKKRSKS